MTSKKLRPIAIAVLALALAVSTTAATSAGAGESTRLAFASYEDAVPGVVPPGALATAVFLDQSGQVIPMTATADPSAEAAGLWCTPVSGRDNPHRSAAGVAVSGHGWWNKGTCTKSLADVWNCLYKWYTDNSWRVKACAPLLRLAPGGGAGNRTTARINCHATTPTSCMNRVDVNVVDEADSGEQPYNTAAVSCRVF